jgi:predicted transcriptional regulator
MEDFFKLKVKDVMHDRVWDLPLVDEKTTVKVVFIILTTRGYVWVVNNTKEMKIVGIITEHDVLHLLEKFDANMNAGMIAKKELIDCSADTKITDIVEKIRLYNVRRIPVVDNGKLIGEITLRHLIEKLYSIFT